MSFTEQIRQALQIGRRLPLLERRIAEFERELVDLKSASSTAQAPAPAPAPEHPTAAGAQPRPGELQGIPASAPIVIERISIENITVEKLEYSNNFGALGIRELAGRLNIGTNMFGEPGPGGGRPQTKNGGQQVETGEDKEKAGSGPPRWNIRGRTPPA